MTGCNNAPGKRESNTITIDHIIDSIGFDNLVEDYKFVELSQDSGFVIGDINQVVIDNDRIFISSDGVYCYDIEGRPLYKITSKGHSKSEFVNCTSISVNDGYLYMYDKQTRLIHKYNSIDGSLICNTEIPIVARGVFKIPDIYVIDKLFPSDFYNGKGRIITTNDFSEVKEEYLETDQYKTPFVNQVTYCKKSVIFSDYQGSSFCRFDRTGCIEYDIQCKEVFPLPREDSNRLSIDDDYIYGLSDVYENDDYIVGRFQFGNAFSFIYDKKSRKTIAYKYYHSGDYRLGLFSICGEYNDYFVYAISSDDYDYFKEAYGFGSPLPVNHTDYRKQKLLMEHVSDANPIIALYKFKKI